ncbi:MAG: hypothetical protein V1742_05560, partial [Pseudomonadota bacterium]
MAARTPGKNKPRGRTSPGGKRPASAKSGPKDKSKGRVGKKTGAKGSTAKKAEGNAGAKSSSRKAKKGSSPGKSSSWTGGRPYWLGLSLGLLLGCLAAVLSFYLPKALEKKQPSAQIPTKPPLVQPKAPKAKAGLLYEEPHRLEKQIKMLDQGIYSAFHEMGVPDEDVNFLKVSPR